MPRIFGVRLTQNALLVVVGVVAIPPAIAVVNTIANPANPSAPVVEQPAPPDAQSPDFVARSATPRLEGASPVPSLSPYTPGPVRVGFDEVGLFDWDELSAATRDAAVEEIRGHLQEAAKLAAVLSCVRYVGRANGTDVRRDFTPAELEALHERFAQQGVSLEDGQLPENEDFAIARANSVSAAMAALFPEFGDAPGVEVKFDEAVQDSDTSEDALDVRISLEFVSVDEMARGCAR